MCTIDVLEKYLDSVESLANKGYSISEIANKLGISESEVRTIYNFYYY